MTMRERRFRRLLSSSMSSMWRRQTSFYYCWTHRSNRRRWWTTIGRDSRNSWTGKSFRNRRRQSRSSGRGRSSASGRGRGNRNWKPRPMASPTVNPFRTTVGNKSNPVVALIRKRKLDMTMRFFFCFYLSFKQAEDGWGRGNVTMR